MRLFDPSLFKKRPELGALFLCLAWGDERLKLSVPDVE